ncbi:MAG: glycosyltransferase [Anaerolineae bacterium]
MTESQSVRILILTADAGAGHRSAANALDGALRARYGDRVVTAIVNPLHEPHAPMAFRLAEENYLNRVQATPTLYQLQHEATDSPLSAAIFSLSARLLLTRTMTRLLVRWQPDVVVSVYMLYSEAVAAASARLGRPIPHITVITDLGSTVHAVWFSPHDTLCVVSSEVVRRKALTCGMDEAHVVVAGIPVDRRFGQPTAPASTLRAELGWEADTPAILLMSGGAGIGHVADLAAAIDAACLPAQLVVVVGRNEELEEHLRAVAWRNPTHIYGFTREVPTLMHASDIVLTKAGGLSVSEALAAGLPIILHSAIQGQETGNVEHVVEHGAGVWAPTSAEVVRTLRRWLVQDPQEWRRYTDAARALGRAQAADDVAGLAFDAGYQAQGQMRPAAAPPRLITRMRPLRAWAGRYARRMLRP